MKLKVNNQFLDFDAPITIEKTVKLFEDISSTEGDVSFGFEIPKTARNMDILGNPMPDVSEKSILEQVECFAIDDAGVTVYRGFLRVERVTDVINAAFYSGNSNWFSLLTGTLQELYLGDFDTEINQTNIEASWNDTTGVYFPFIDAGVLSTRQRPDLLVEDFYPFMYVHTIIQRIFNSAGIKIQGELLNDFRYKNLITAGGVAQENSIEIRSTYANKTASQAVSEASGTEAIIYDDDSTDPFFDGSENNYDTTTGRYTADVGMRVKVEATAEYSSTANVYRITINKNGGAIPIARGYGNEKLSVSAEFNIAATDFIEVRSEVLNTGGSANITAGTLRITPVYIYKVSNGEFLPKWTQQEFVAEIFNLFNVIPSFNPVSKTLTVNLFEKLPQKTPIDLSQYLDGDIEYDYTEIVETYGNRTRLSYEEYEFSEHYNRGNEVPFGAKDITVNNGYIAPTVDALQSGFIAPFAAKNTAFSADVCRFRFVELNELTTEDITSVTDNSGQARVNMTVDGFSQGELVRIDCTLDDYNGDWVIQAVGVGYIECLGMQFIANATGEATALEHVFVNNSEAYLMLAAPNRTITDFSFLDAFTVEMDSEATIAYAYFNLLDSGLTINNLKHSLSFGPVNNPNHYQIDMYSDYFRLFKNVLDNPVKGFCNMLLPRSVFNRIDHLSPALIKTKDTHGLYYINLITGYEASHLPCEVELIKLSTGNAREGSLRSSFEDEYVDILEYAESQAYRIPSEDQQVKQNDFLKNLKGDGIWTGLDILYVFATDGDQDFAKINWKNPGTFNCSEVSSPTFTADQGFTGNATNAYLNTGWDPTNNGVNYTQDEAGWFIYVNSGADATSQVFGTADTDGGTALDPYNGGTQYSYQINGNAELFGSSVDPLGLFHCKRTSSTAVSLYKDGALLESVSIASNGTSNQDLYILARNNNGSAQLFTSFQVSLFGAGASLTGKESALDNLWDNYFSNI